MKRIITGVITAVMAVLIVAPAVFATALPDSTPAAESIKVYRNLIETSDVLFVVYSNKPYVTPPSDPSSEVFIWELIDTDGTTVLGSTTGYDYVNDGYGYQVISMYFPASAGISWNPASPYTIRLRGIPIQFTTPPVYDYTVSPGYYTSLSDSDSVKAELAADILKICEDLDGLWGLSVSLISEEETGQVLSTFGQAYFRGCIYSIQALAPSLFPLAIRNIDIANRTWTDAYSLALDNQYDGTWIDTAKAAGGALFGLEYDLLSLILLMGMVFGVIIGNVAITNNHWNGIMDAAFVLVVCTRIGLLGLGYLLLMAALCLIYMAIKLWSIIRG
jgi:hypothetical protein